MSRTTLDLDPTILRELKRRARDEGKSLGAVASELLAPIVKAPRRERNPRFRWHTARMGPALVDLEDKEAVRNPPMVPSFRVRWRPTRPPRMSSA